MTRETILAQLHQQHRALTELGVSRIGLFGSRSRGEANTTSDIDLLLDFFPGRKNFDNYMQACRLLESLFDTPVDIVTREAISPYLLPYIEQEVIYESA